MILCADEVMSQEKEITVEGKADLSAAAITFATECLATDESLKLKQKEIREQLKDDPYERWDDFQSLMVNERLADAAGVEDDKGTQPIRLDIEQTYFLVKNIFTGHLGLNRTKPEKVLVEVKIVATEFGRLIEIDGKKKYEPIKTDMHQEFVSISLIEDIESVLRATAKLK